MASESFYGSICITDIIDKVKQKHSSFTKSPKNGKIYCNVTVWLNEEKDEYGNVMSIQANTTEEKKNTEKKFYLGNCKKSVRKDPVPISDKDTNIDIDGEFDDINPPQDIASDLPF